MPTNPKGFVANLLSEHRIDPFNRRPDHAGHCLSLKYNTGLFRLIVDMAGSRATNGVALTLSGGHWAVPVAGLYCDVDTA